MRQKAFAIYDVMRYVKPPIFTLCIANAWGEAALLLAAGSKGNRSALPSSTIMIKQPICKVSRPSYRRGPCKEGSEECEGRVGNVFLSLSLSEQKCCSTWGVDGNYDSMVEFLEMLYFCAGNGKRIKYWFDS